VSLAVLERRARLDEAASRDFLAEVLARADAPALEALANGVGRKHRRVLALLDQVRDEEPGALQGLLALVFSCRRRSGEIVEAVGEASLRRAVLDLVDGPAPVTARFDRLAEALAPLGPVAFDLPGELLHFADPEQYWLWSRWMWDPERETGALALVAADPLDADLGYGGAGYLEVGSVVAAVQGWLSARGVQLGSSEVPRSATADVLVACVYAVYMYTVLRLRMTQEFNRLVPPLPDLVGRLLGVRYVEG
jgi:hypothetical protein